MSATHATSPSSKTGNPYVGPRAFRQGEALPARDRETRALANLLIAERVVLLHAPSGAGKTSLIQAALHDRLSRGDRFHPTPALRVNAPLPDRLRVSNRYTFSVGLGLLDGSPKRLAHLELKDIVEEAKQRHRKGFFVLVIDQLEELLLIDPSDRDNQRAFFKQLGKTLEDGTVWVLLSMREDYMGGLDRFLRFVPGQLSTRYRLDFLDHEAATIAIREPAAAHGVDFIDKAAARLVKRLATTTKQIPGGGEQEVPAPYVQPVQLQVVCRKLWRSVSREQRDKSRPFRSIGVRDVDRHADIDAALRSYYAGVVQHAAQETGADEDAIRRWFESDLITPQGYRSQTLKGPESGNVDPAKILKSLEDGYLIRGDTRAESTWYEIAHDKLVAPIIDDNDNALRERSEPWQLAAAEWGKNEDPSRLFSGVELRNAQKQADKMELRIVERKFLEASHRLERDYAGVFARTQNRVTLVELVAAVEAVAIVVLLVVLYVSLS